MNITLHLVVFAQLVGLLVMLYSATNSLYHVYVEYVVMMIYVKCCKQYSI